MRRFALVLLNHRWMVIIALLIISLVTIPGVLKLKVNNSIRIWFVEDDPYLLDFTEFEDTFGGEEFIVIALKDDKGIINPRALTIIREMGKELVEIDGISYVVSITDAVDVWGTADGIEVGRLVEDIPETKEELDELKDRIFSNPLFIGTIISEDGKTTLITARLKKMALVDDDRAEIVKKTREIAGKYQEEWGDKIYVAGVPILNIDLNELTLKDLLTFVPITVLLTVFTIFFTMRRWSAVFLSIGSVALSVGIVIGIYNLTGTEINMVTTMVPTLIMVIGVADSIHIINHYFEQSRKGGTKKEILTRTIAVIGVPCLMTTVTTAVGFSALAISQMVPVRETGLFTSLGIVAAFVVTITVIPIGYSFLRVPDTPLDVTKKRGVHKREGGIISFVTGKFYYLARRYPYPVIVFGLALLSVSVFFITKIKVETQNMEFMHDDHPLRVSYSFIENGVGNISPCEVVIEGEPGSAYEPTTMAEVEKFQRFLEDDPNISKTLAATDLIKRLNMAYMGNDPDEYVVPDSREGIAQLLLLYEFSPEGELGFFINFDASTLRINGRATNLNSSQCKELMEKINTYCDENLPEGLKGHMTGIVPLYVNMVDYIVKSQIFSFSLAFVLIFFLLTVQLKSIRLGLISIIPNIIPIAMTMGAMGLFGINLDTATVMISTVAIGIAVDDTIHFLNRFKLEFKRTGSYEESVETSLHTSGRAIISTSIILFFGFWTLLFGSFKPTNYFGFLSGITMLTALVGDLLILPAVILVLKPKI